MEGKNGVLKRLIYIVGGTDGGTFLQPFLDPLILILSLLGSDEAVVDLSEDGRLSEPYDRASTAVFGKGG